jgi:hypothetical protein
MPIEQLLNADFVLVLHFMLTVFMTGLIWTIQLVHYPTFHYINLGTYTTFHEFHMKRISIIVVPVMTLELLTGLLLVVLNPERLNLINIVFLILIWISTAVLSVPSHANLEKSYSFNEVTKLVKTNWPRTLFWTLRTAILFYSILFTIIFSL